MPAPAPIVLPLPPSLGIRIWAMPPMQRNTPCPALQRPPMSITIQEQSSRGPITALWITVDTRPHP
ncbi:hypothetical protein [Deinococcus aquatilis]|uniref:hypothetical protein n=1 Tax=Deinococcus aquatilis TaxID=519440 RepID=UPI0012FC784B|nr:hypothetical protein [Deinococcus aquatilis]